MTEREHLAEAIERRVGLRRRLTARARARRLSARNLAIRRRAETSGDDLVLRWAIKIGAPDDETGDTWGDLFFAEDLARALRVLGQEVFVDRHQTRKRQDVRPDDVVVNLRGYYAHHIDEGAVNIVWVISHPNWVSDDELTQGYDAIFAASETWSRRKSDALGISVVPLFQATDPGRFSIGRGDPELESDILFLGKSRNVFRPIVKDAIAVGAPLSIVGDNWDQFVPKEFIVSEFLANDRIPAAYRSARIVLNDHWEDMRAEGFLSNRLFDAAACGARIVSDDMGGLTSLFRGSVFEYTSLEELKHALHPDHTWPDREERRRTAEFVADEHSFDARARTLLDAAQKALES